MSDFQVTLLGSNPININASQLFTADGKPTGLSAQEQTDFLTGGNWKNSVNIKLSKNISLDTSYANKYCQLPANGVFDGQNNTIDLTNVTTSGLFATGGSDLATGSVVQNLGVTNGGTTTNSGFIIRFEQKFFTVENCYSTGLIGTSGGGICGGNAGKFGNCTIKNCYSTGLIGTSGGGICGVQTDNCYITNCYSTGKINTDGGGICGLNTGIYNGNCIIENCYSTGYIDYTGGGICPGTRAVTIKNCYSCGNSNINSGGIIYSTINNAHSLIVNCFTTSNNIIYSVGSLVHIINSYSNQKIAVIINNTAPPYYGNLKYNSNSTTITEVTQTANIPNSGLFYVTNKLLTSEQYSNFSYTYGTKTENVTIWNTSLIWQTPTADQVDSDRYPRLKAFMASPWNSDYINYLSTPALSNINNGLLLKVDFANKTNTNNGTITITPTLSTTYSWKDNGTTSSIVTSSRTGLSAGTYEVTATSGTQSTTRSIIIEDPIYKLEKLTSSTFVYSSYDIFTTNGAPTDAIMIAYKNSTNWVEGVQIKLLKNTSLDTTYASKYCQLPASGVFDGQGYTIDFGTTIGIKGLFSTNYDTTLDSDLTKTKEDKISTASIVKNFGIIGGTTLESGGFIIRGIQKFFTVENCYSTGIIELRAGGIVGNWAGKDGYCIIKNCYSTGSIGNTAGGICGYQACVDGYCSIQNCFSTGFIGGNAGGICGGNAGYRGFCSIQNCYSTGDIDNNAGGICGIATATEYGFCLIQNCYSVGNQITSGSGGGGGICGLSTCYNSGSCVIQNCYSTGYIPNNAGGICGNYTGKQNGKVYIYNSYCNGKLVYDVYVNGNVYYNVDPNSSLPENAPLTSASIPTISLNDIYNKIRISDQKENISFSIPFGSGSNSYLVSITKWNIYDASTNANGIWQTPTSDQIDSDRYPRLKAFMASPWNSDYINYLSTPALSNVINKALLFKVGFSNIINSNLCTINMIPISALTPSPTYQWYIINNGDYTPIAGATSNIYSNFSISRNTSYYVYATNGNQISTRVINIEYNLKPIITPQSTTTFCQGLNVILKATPVPNNSDYFYQWKKNGINIGTNGNTSNELSVTQSGSYTVTITYNGVESISDATVVTVNPLPIISGPQSLCKGGTDMFQATTTPASYPWTSSNTSVATINSSGLITAINSGTVTITYINSNGCQATATVKVNDLPVINGISITKSFVPNNSIVSGSLIVNITNPTNYDYSWKLNGSNLGVSTQEITNLSGFGTYEVTVTDKNTNCKQILTLVVTEPEFSVYLSSLPNITFGYVKGNIFTNNGNPTDIDSSLLNSGSWKNNIIIKQLKNITLTDGSIYCQLPAYGVFDGQGKTIDLTNVTTSGLFSTNYDTTLNSNLNKTKEDKLATASKIQNLGVTNGVTTNGFIIRSSQKYFTIENCYSTGNMIDMAGGICGSAAGYFGYCLIKNCYSTGNYSSGRGTGGICGPVAGNYGLCQIENCYSTGNMVDGGGICSQQTGENGFCIIKNCYSTGNITQGGGICGAYTGGRKGICLIQNCYSTGNINNGGGICGYSNSYYDGTCIIQNCYSKGNQIGPNAGGIFSYNMNKLYIYNSYCTGKLVANISGSVYYNVDPSTGTPLTSGSEIPILTLNNITNTINIDNQVEFSSFDIIQTSVTPNITYTIPAVKKWNTTNIWMKEFNANNPYPRLAVFKQLPWNCSDYTEYNPTTSSSTKPSLLNMSSLNIKQYLINNVSCIPNRIISKDILTQITTQRNFTNISKDYATYYVVTVNSVVELTYDVLSNNLVHLIFANEDTTTSGTINFNFKQNGQTQLATYNYAAKSILTKGQTYYFNSTNIMEIPIFTNTFKFVAEGSGTLNPLSSFNSFGDPYITTINEKTYKLPDEIATYRLFEGKDIIVNAEVDYISDEQQEKLRTIEKKLKEKHPNLSKLKMITSGVLYSKFYINNAGEELLIDMKTKKVHKLNENHNIIIGNAYLSTNNIMGINDCKCAKVPIDILTKNFGKLSLELQFYENPQIENGINITIEKNGQFVGLLVDTYKESDMKVSDIKDTTTKLNRSYEIVFKQNITQDNEIWTTN